MTTMKKLLIPLTAMGLSCLATTKASDWAISPNYDFGTVYKVALVAEEEGTLDEVAYNQVSMQLLKVGNLAILERERVAGLLAEQEFGTSGAVDPSSAARIGALTGADLVGVVSFTRNQGAVLIKLVNTETGEVLYMGQGIGVDFNSAAQKALAPLLDEAAKKK